MQTTQKLIVTAILAALFAGPSAAQDYRVLAQDSETSRVLDYTGRIRHGYDAARGGMISFPSAVRSSVSPREIVAGYLRGDGTSSSIELIRSIDGGRSWSSEAFDDDPVGDVPRSLSLFNLGRQAFSARRSTQNRHRLMMMFAGGSPIVVSSSYTDGKQWSRFYPVGDFGGFRVSSVIRIGNNRLMALMHDDGRFLYGQESLEPGKSVIYKMYSSDGGVTWSDPVIALKHNLYGLYDATAIYSPARNNRELILVASQRETGAACVSFSSDHGESWSYPLALSSRLCGDRFAVCTHGRNLYIAFRDLCRTLDNGLPNPTFGDLVLWTGDRKELARGGAAGIKVRLADNYPAGRAVDPSDPNFSDLGTISLLPTGRSEITVIASGRWETEERPFVRAILFDPAELRAAAEN
jgi:hypothetical protein